MSTPSSPLSVASPNIHQRRRSSVRSTTSSSSRFSEIRQHEYVYALDDANISEWLKCPICFNPFIEPRLISSCEHVFCKACIDQHIETIINRDRLTDHPDDENPEQSHQKEIRGHCPSCRIRFKTSQLRPAATLIKNMVDSLLVKCPNESRGCAHSAERCLIGAHIQRDCPYTYVDEATIIEESTKKNGTTNESRNGRCGCGKKIMRKDWQAHITSGDCTVERKSCPFANVENGCGTMVRESDLEAHLLVCPARTTECQHCVLEFRQDELEEHEERCEEVQIECPLAPHCVWKGRRGDLGVEEDGDQAASLHLAECKFSPLRTFLNSNSIHLNELEQDNTRLNERMSTMERQQRELVKLLSHCIAAIGQDYGPYQEVDLSQLPQRHSHSDTVVPISSPPRNVAMVPPPLALRGRPGSANGVARPIVSETEANEPTRASSYPAPFASAPIEDNTDAEPWQWPVDSQIHNGFGEGSVWEQVSSHLNRINLTGYHHPTKSNITDSLHSINSTLSALTDRIIKVERRLDDTHVVSMNAGFEAGRAHDELNSVRHGMHSIRLQMHSLLMQQQMERSLPISSPQGPSGPHNLYAAAAVAAQQQHPEATSSPAQNTQNLNFHNAVQPSQAGRIGLRRFWTGFEQTRL